MMNTNKKTPKLRFKGFTDDWEQRKLGDFYTFKNGLNKEKVYFGYGDSIVNFTDVFHNRQIYSSTLKGKVCVNKKELENYKVKEGDLFFTRTSETIDEIGFPAVVMEPMERVVFSGFVLRGRAEKYDPLVNIFKSYIFFTNNFRSEMKKKSSMTTRALTSGTALKEMYFSYPKDLEEQTKIGEILLRLDKIITLHQRKLEKLKLNKSALLQKLFPQKGCTIPDVRFKGFTDAWEQRKLNDFGIATGGTSIESEFVDGGTYKVINIGSYSEESVYNDQGLRVNKTDKTKSRILNKYDLTMILNDKTASGNIIGRVLLIDQDNTYVYNQRTERIEVDTKNFLPMFLYHMLNAPEQRKYIVKASQGNTQIYVNWSTISNIDYMIPQLLLEQEKIANLFSLINKDITLHQRKLDCLISIKKGLLQQLFV